MPVVASVLTRFFTLWGGVANADDNSRKAITESHICNGNQNQLEEAYLYPNHAKTQAESIMPATAKALAVDHEILKTSVARLINLHSNHLTLNYTRTGEVMSILLIPRVSNETISDADLIESGSNIADVIFHNGQKVNITSFGTLEQDTNSPFEDAVIDYEKSPHILEHDDKSNGKSKSIVHAGKDKELEKSESALAIVILGTDQLKIGLVKKVKSAITFSDSIRSASRVAAAL